MIYFAYGSNLLKARLQARTPRARPLGKATLSGHVPRFHKRGDDGSAKYDAFFTGNPDDLVHGVTYAMDLDEKRILDAIEGAGYVLKYATVMGPNPIAAFFYVAEPDWIEPDMAPFDWYRDFIVAGALENDFPKAYTDEIIATPARSDPDHKRRAANAKILAGSRIAAERQDLFKNTT